MLWRIQKKIWTFVYSYFSATIKSFVVCQIWVNLDISQCLQFMRWQWWLQLPLRVQCWWMWFVSQLHLVSANRWCACVRAFGNDPMFYYLHRKAFYEWWCEEPWLASERVPSRGVFVSLHQKSNQRKPSPTNAHWLMSMWYGCGERRQTPISAFPNLFLALPETITEIQFWLIFIAHSYGISANVFTRFFFFLGYVHTMLKICPFFSA